MDRTQYAKYFFDTNLPIANCDRIKSFIADQFGFDRTYINILRSSRGHTYYPLFQDKSNNFIVFGVKGYTFSCINGDLQILDKEG